MKKSTYLVLGLALAGLTACQNLDEKLVGSVTTQYFSTGAGLDAALMGDYSLLRGFWGKEQSFAVTEFGTDLETNGDQGSYIYENTYAGGLSAADTHYYLPVADLLPGHQRVQRGHRACPGRYRYGPRHQDDPHR